MNAVSTPSSSPPPTTRTAPIPSTSASERLPTSRTAIVNVATTSSASLFAPRNRSFSAAMIASLRGSRRNACTARIPFMVSTNCTMIFAIEVRVPR